MTVEREQGVAQRVGGERPLRRRVLLCGLEVARQRAANRLFGAEQREVVRLARAVFDTQAWMHICDAANQRGQAEAHGGQRLPREQNTLRDEWGMYDAQRSRA